VESAPRINNQVEETTTPTDKKEAGYYSYWHLMSNWGLLAVPLEDRCGYVSP
jgi:hypothetical protein